jgi:hypothetical protein
VSLEVEVREEEMVHALAVIDIFDNRRVVG